MINVTMIEIDEAKETGQFSSVGRSGPISDGSQFCWIRANTLSGNPMAQEHCLCLEKLALAGFQLETCRTDSIEDCPKAVHVNAEILTEDEDIVKISQTECANVPLEHE